MDPIIAELKSLSENMAVKKSPSIKKEFYTPPRSDISDKNE